MYSKMKLAILASMFVGGMASADAYGEKVDLKDAKDGLKSVRFSNYIESSTGRPSIVELASEIRDLELVSSGPSNLITPQAQFMSSNEKFRKRLLKEANKQEFTDHQTARTYAAYFLNGQRVDSATYSKLNNNGNPNAYDDHMCMLQVTDLSEKPSKAMHIGAGVYGVSAQSSGSLYRLPVNWDSKISIQVNCLGGFEQNMTVENFVKALGATVKDVRDLRLRNRINKETVPERTTEMKSRPGVG